MFFIIVKVNVRASPKVDEAQVPGALRRLAAARRGDGPLTTSQKERAEVWMELKSLQNSKTGVRNLVLDMHIYLYYINYINT